MHRRHSLLLLACTLAACAPTGGGDLGEAAGALGEEPLPEPQVVLPIHNQTELDPTETYVTPSATTE